MPELPEVQTTVDDLNKRVSKRRIEGVWFNWQKLKDIQKTKGLRINKIKRIGKNLLFYLSDDQLLLVHMKMTGHFLIGKWKINGKKVTPLTPPELKERVNDFIHFLLILDNGEMIGFSDLRKFGKVIFNKTKKIENLPELKKIGPDALQISYEDLYKRLKKRNKTIYQTLMDQTAVAGIGNIYANDILFKAQINPLKTANKLTKEEVKILHSSIKPILLKAYKRRGTSSADYRDTFGKKGSYGQVRLIYQREGEKCPKHCGGIVIRRKIGGRSAFYCPSCQKI